ncbi:NAD(P)/FAD-dependent oxidoreductase [Staphylococcus gallinarum]|uniref:NAD(P)/FAD-dependent oxidoreductase n=1 Tax=Staphylococcus gallinarum TaxID=1293 RepID=UPI001E4870E7|nr:FAD-dependent oxidoreductase [Staphylococcus gallinarum]MCD8909444.1 NAD(P)/FAD-dependent oxidoreductase [Staphylococcus gallinarum]MCD8919963.1 NAD(P)/FAD-dependent oxidoreductase [Staphylococcus gallinarum]UEH00259.1 NAD(P)/FAD-dependent oxidoreductase [Staphylococcus gallinarum]
MWDLIVIGSGPAGLKAAIKAAENGLSTIVVDEFPRPGGRLLGQLYKEKNGEWWNGIKESERLVEEAKLNGVIISCQTSVYDIEKLDELWCVYTNKKLMKSHYLLIATGASERHIPIPGWTLPGVMSIGAAQVMSNVHRVKPGESCIIIGINVLSLSIADELKMSGLDVEAIILPYSPQIDKEASEPKAVIAKLMYLTHLAPSRLLRILGVLGKYLPVNMVTRFYPKNGLRMNKMPIKVKTAAQKIIGNEVAKGVEVINIDSKGRKIEGTEKLLKADVICISGGLAPLSELAAIVGCRFKYSEALGGHIPIHNERMETEVSNLFVAGNVTGIESAKVAMAQGELAGLNIAQQHIKNNNYLKQKLKQAIYNVKKTRSEALIQFQPNIERNRENLYREIENTQ